jgi:hypothetical protein
MRSKSLRCFRFILPAFAMLFALINTAVAGPPLICHSFDIGNAKSLPWISHDWNLTGAEKYDTHNLVTDTLAVLDSSQVTLVHMETLRRATLYARKDPVAAKQLLLKLIALAESTESSRHANALAVFDAGYLSETFKQWLGEGAQNPSNSLDGYALVKKAIQLSHSDSQMEFAAALIALKAPTSENQEHAQKAIAGARKDELLARNLNTRFLGPQSQTMAEVIQRNNTPNNTTKIAKQ